MQPNTTRLWNITFGFSLMLFLWTPATAQQVDSTVSTTVTSKDVSSPDHPSPKEELVAQTDSSRLPYKLEIHNETTASNLDIKPVRANLTHLHDVDSAVTTTEDGQLVGNTTDDTNQDPPQGFNYAIIAAIGGLVLVTALCLKCCTWFRAYTRGGDKDESTRYAAILHTGDEEYGHIDLQSETASTVYFDTISSYHSFLKRHGTNNSMPSSGSPKFKFYRQNSNSPRKENRKPVFKDLDMKYIDMKQTRTGTLAETPDTCSPRSESAMSDNIRTFSVSSEDTDPSSQTLSLSHNEDVNNKRMPRSKVSFTTDMSTGTNNSNRLERQRSFNRTGLKYISFDRHNRSMSCRNSHRLSDMNDDADAFRLKPTNATTRSQVPGSGVDVATQTNRSFTYSRWKSRKRHYSDSGVDEMVGPPTIHELSASNFTDNCGHTCVSTVIPSKAFPTMNIPNDLQTVPTFMPHKIAIPQLNTQSDQLNPNPQELIGEIPGKMDGQSIPRVLNERINGRRLNCEASISESESNDDVFVTDGAIAAVTAGVDMQQVSDNNNSCKCVVSRDGEHCDCIQGICEKDTTLYVGQSSKPSADPDVAYKHGDESAVISNQCHAVYNAPKTDKDVVMETHITNCKDCLQRYKLISEKKPSRCKSGTSCDMFLIHELDVADNDKCDVYGRRDSFDCDICSAVSNQLSPGGVSKNGRRVDKLNNVVIDSHTLIVEPDMTSSMTSLESSGYAEISTDASTS